jgi:C_GCAxxG_C_C family probable redox protein
MMAKRRFMTNGEKAVACFTQGFNCSQALLSTYGDANGLPRDTALRVAGAFGAGMGHRGDTCGAVTGALMVVGLTYGQSTPEDEAAKEKTYGLAAEFCRRFKSTHESIVCRDLLVCDLSTTEGLAHAREHRLFALRCPTFVQSAAAILDDIL